MELFISICLGIGLAACSGFRVFIPLLISSLDIHFGLVHVSGGFEFMGTWTAITVLFAATVAEITAYYIPWLDNLLDTIALPLSFVAGTILTTSFVQIDNPVLHWGLGLLMGGGMAGFIQAGTTLTRLASTKLSGGLANPVVSTVENITSVSLTLLTFWFPIFAFALVVLLLVWLGKKIATKL